MFVVTLGICLQVTLIDVFLICNTFVRASLRVILSVFGNFEGWLALFCSPLFFLSFIVIRLS